MVICKRAKGWCKGTSGEPDSSVGEYVLYCFPISTMEI